MARTFARFRNCWATHRCPPRSATRMPRFANCLRSLTRRTRALEIAGGEKDYSSAVRARAWLVSFPRRRRKKKVKCLALHSRQRNGRRSKRSRMVHSSTPRRRERATFSLPQRGHRRKPTHSEIACVRVITFHISSCDITTVHSNPKCTFAVKVQAELSSAGFAGGGIRGGESSPSQRRENDQSKISRSLMAGIAHPLPARDCCMSWTLSLQGDHGQYEILSKKYLLRVGMDCFRSVCRPRGHFCANRRNPGVRR